MKSDRVSRRAEFGAVSALYLVVALAVTAPILSVLYNWGIQDWDQHLFQHGVPRSTLLDYHELPLWNPYNWSGVPLLANPESRVLSPTFVLTLVFGEVVALKLEIVLFLVLGMLGTYGLVREYGAERGPAAAAGCCFMLNSSFAVHLSVGHVWILGAAYLPWAFLGYLRAESDLRYSVLSAGALALMLFGGGVYPFMATLLLFATHSALELMVSREGALGQARRLAAIVLQALGLGAIKLLPTLALVWRHPRTTDLEGGYSLVALWNALFSRSQGLTAAFSERPADFNGTSLHEGLYIGLLAVLPLVVGLLSNARRCRVLLLSCGVFVWLSLGDQVVPSLWSAVHLLPGFDNMRMPQRFGLVVILCFSVFLGLGLQELRVRILRWTRSERIAAGLVAAASLLVVGDQAWVASRVFREAFPIRALEMQRVERFEQLRNGRRYDEQGFLSADSNPLHLSTSGLYPAFLSNRGLTNGYEILPVPSMGTPARDPGYRGEAYLDGSAGDVAIARWSPNSLALDVTTADSAFLVVNQNFAPGWSARAGKGETLEARSVIERSGLLTVPVLPGDRRVELRYRPTSFFVGAAISGISLWIAAAFVRRPRRPGRDSDSALA